MQNAVNTIAAPGALLLADDSGAVVLLDTSELASGWQPHLAGSLREQANKLYKVFFRDLYGINQGFRQPTRTGAWRLHFDGRALSMLPLVSVPEHVTPQTISPCACPWLSWSACCLQHPDTGISQKLQYPVSF